LEHVCSSEEGGAEAGCLCEGVSEGGEAGVVGWNVMLVGFRLCRVHIVAICGMRE
jgi:hypothetical protein